MTALLIIGAWSLVSVGLGLLLGAVMKEGSGVAGRDGITGSQTRNLQAVPLLIAPLFTAGHAGPGVADHAGQGPAAGHPHGAGSSAGHERPTVGRG